MRSLKLALLLLSLPVARCSFYICHQDLDAVKQLSELADNPMLSLLGKDLPDMSGLDDLKKHLQHVYFILEGSSDSDVVWLSAENEQD